MSSPPNNGDSFQEEPGYEPDTDDVQSLDSEVLYEYRPNRWKGRRDKWQTLTEAERLDYRAVNNIRNQDLSIHLYNAFAMKNRRNAALSAPPLTRSASYQTTNTKRDWRQLTTRAGSKEAGNAAVIR